MKDSRIILVDDEKMVTSAFKTLLKVEGYTNIECFNKPEEALKYLGENAPDIVVSDFLMPDMNGLEFLTEVKNMYPEVSMIMLTMFFMANMVKTVVFKEF